MTGEVRGGEKPSFTQAALKPGSELRFFIFLVIFVLITVATSLYNYLLFHTIAEIFIILIAGVMFIIAWNTRRYLDNNYLLFIGIAYFFISIIELLHTLAYTGMNIFIGYGTNLPTQLWIAARFLEAATLLIAPLMLTRRMHPYREFFLFGVVTAGIVAAIFVTGTFPVCFIEDQGLTPFKVTCEYVIVLLLAGALALLWTKRRSFEPVVYRLLAASILFTIVAEFFFTQYVTAYGPANLIGHLFTLVSVALVYRAIVVSALQRPFDLIFRELALSEQNVRQQHDRVARYLEIAEVILLVLDTKGVVTMINRKGAELLGFPAAEIIGTNWYETYVPEDQRAQVLERLARVLDESVKESLQVENEILTADGKRRMISWRNAVIRDKNGEISGILSSGEDITDLREARRGLLIKDAAISSSPDGVIIIGPDERVMYANPAYLHLLGYGGLDEIAGLPITDIAANASRVREMLEGIRRDGHWTGEYRATFRDGRAADLLVSATVATDSDGTPICTMASVIDVTEMQLYRKALEEANKKLGLLSSITRHDVLNQVHVILSYVELLKDLLPASEPAGTYLKGLEAAGRTIHNQINFTRDYHRMGVDAPLWQKVAEVFQENRYAWGPDTLIVRTDVGDVEVYADPMLEKVFYNLLDNAVRHGGGVTTVTVTFREEEGTGIIVVEDDGSGVPEGEKEHIFERGVGKNTGFGLFLTREVLGLTGITIHETGREGSGARFELMVPPGVWRRGAQVQK
jgi:PAS domain S-box-containing protein